MNRALTGLSYLGVIVGSMILTDQASGQPLAPRRVGSPPPPPTVSPYLNLLRGGASPGVNYYGLVRPQQYFQNSIQGLQQGQAAGPLNPVVGGQADGSDLPGTGVPVQFMNHYAFFMNVGGFGTQPGRGGSAAAGGRAGGMSAMQSLQSGARAAAPPPRTR